MKQATLLFATRFDASDALLLRHFGSTQVNPQGALEGSKYVNRSCKAIEHGNNTVLLPDRVDSGQDWFEVGEMKCEFAL